MPKARIEEYFRDKGLTFTKYTHPAVFTCDDTADRYTEQGIPIQKSLVLRNKKKTQYWMFTVRGDRRTDLKAIGELVGDRVSFAGETDLQELLQTYPGACSPYGLIFDTDKKVEFWIEDALMENEHLGFHPNDNTETWKMTSQDFKRFIEGTGRPLQTVKF